MKGSVDLYSALDIARYVIDYSWDNKNTVSNLRVQKILYFVQAEFLVSKNSACFNDEIQAWSLGPVVPSVYHEYKIFGNSPIPSRGTNGQYYSIDESDKKIIEDIVNQCNEHTTATLVNITHNQTPWIEAFNSSNKIITTSSIKAFFSEE